MKKLIIAIFVFGALTRLLFLGTIPQGFFRDEAALGYNAYSMWLTGKDEYGQALPIVFRSFEVFFLPFYDYISAPIVVLLGLNEFSTRLPSSLAGIVLIILAYKIAKKLWGVEAGVFSGLLLAISPWGIIYSRGAFEGHVALALFAAGFYFWLLFLEKEKWRDVFISLLFFIASMYSYQSERFVTPIFGLVILIFSWRNLWDFRKKLVVPAIVAVIALAPLLSLSLRAGGYHRALGVSIFAQEGNPPGWVSGEQSSLFVNNRLFLRTKQISALYFSYFSPRNLFVEGDANAQRSVPDYSVFYFWFFPLLCVGFFKAINCPAPKTQAIPFGTSLLLAKSRQLERGTLRLEVKGVLFEKLLFVWIILSPLPAAVTGDPFHTYRSLMLYLPLTLLCGLGLSIVYTYAKKKSYGTLLFWSGLLVLVGISTSLFLFNYIFIYPTDRARAWDYGWREVITSISQLPEGTRVVVDDPFTEGYIHYLFFAHIDPSLYHTEVAKLGTLSDYYYTNSDEIRPDRIGSIEFRPIDWPTERGNKGNVFVMWHERLPESEFKTDPNIELLDEINYPNGTVAYRIVRIK